HVVAGGIVALRGSLVGGQRRAGSGGLLRDGPGRGDGNRAKLARQRQGLRDGDHRRLARWLSKWLGMNVAGRRHGRAGAQRRGDEEGTGDELHGEFRTSTL